MDKIQQVIYWVSLLLCLGLSFYNWQRGRRELSTLVLVFFTAVTTETLMLIVKQSASASELRLHRLLYHLYIPLEYSLMAYYFYAINKSPVIQKVILLSIPFYAAISILISYYTITPFIAINDIIPEGQNSRLCQFPMPSYNFNIAGVLLIIFSLITLFTAEVNIDKKMSEHFYYWLCLGLIIFHSGVFILNAVYPQATLKNSKAAADLNVIINQSLNNIMYITFACGFIKTIRWQTAKT
jgi:hypothetical protein